MSSSVAESLTSYTYSLGQVLLTVHTPLSYRDLQRVVLQRMKMQEGYDADALAAPGAWSESAGAGDRSFLRNEPSGSTPGPLLIYNSNRTQWEVVLEDFILLPAEADLRVYEYGKGTLIGGAEGKISSRNNRELFTGGTDVLKEENIYIASVRKGPLQYRVWDLTGPLSLELQGILSSISMDNFSPWDHFEEEEFGEDPLSSSHSTKSTRPRLEFVALEKESTTRKSVAYLPHGDESKEEECLRWETLTRDSLVDSIRQFCRYQYLASLALPSANDTLLRAFDFSYNYWWLTKEGNPNYQHLKHQSLVIDRECLNIEGGSIGYNPWAIEITSHEDFVLFYDVYLVSSDLRIRKLTYKNMSLAENVNRVEAINRIEAGKSVQMKFVEEDVLERVLSGFITAQVKILLSRDPVRIDLSQPGIH
jgi:hypothetical protein